jgi:hypothetical protein
MISFINVSCGTVAVREDDGDVETINFRDTAVSDGGANQITSALATHQRFTIEDDQEVGREQIDKEGRGEFDVVNKNGAPISRFHVEHNTSKSRSPANRNAFGSIISSRRLKGNSLYTSVSGDDDAEDICEVGSGTLQPSTRHDNGSNSDRPNSTRNPITKTSLPHVPN